VYALRRTGVQPLRAAYRNLVSSLGVDAIVLVDGGTDILLRGDESRLGTPVEDIGSLAAVAGLDVPIKLVTCLGFGIDAYHGVNHVQVLENLAALDRDGGYLGALSIPSGSREAALYRDAVAAAQAATPQRPSIVNGQIAAALSGESGDTGFTRRVSGSTLFVNPLMAIYFTVDLMALAARCLYLDRLEETLTVPADRGPDRAVPQRRRAAHPQDLPTLEAWSRPTTYGSHSPPSSARLGTHVSMSGQLVRPDLLCGRGGRTAL
jgi:hypothetical protein